MRLGGTEAEHDDEFERILDQRDISAVFQPVVELDTGDIVAYEALARGPSRSTFHTPDLLFEHAYHVGRADELDWVCRAAAIRSAFAVGLPSGTRLLVNVEPLSLRSVCPPDLLNDIQTGMNRYSIVLELTERAIAADPAAVLPAVQEARQLGIDIAIDDVGAVPASLAMMPLLHPDIIKLDLSLVQSRNGAEQANIVNAVLAEAERTGATILSEGIESAENIPAARAMGAVLGQGWHLGIPVAQPPPPVRTVVEVTRRFELDDPAHQTPFEIVTRNRPAHPANGPLLSSLSRRLEREGFDASEPAVLLTCFQATDRFDAATRARYAELAARATMVAVLGEGMPADPAEGVRGTAVDPDDPLSGEWVVVVIGPHVAAAIVAVEIDGRDLDEGEVDPGPRTFSYALAHDRELVIAAARPLLHRMRPLSRPGPHDNPFETAA